MKEFGCILLLFLVGKGNLMNQNDNSERSIRDGALICHEKTSTSRKRIGYIASGTRSSTLSSNSIRKGRNEKYQTGKVDHAEKSTAAQRGGGAVLPPGLLPLRPAEQRLHQKVGKFIAFTFAVFYLRSSKPCGLLKLLGINALEKLIY